MSTSIAGVMREHGGVPGDFEETAREIESVKAVRFVMHPWMPLPNFGADTFRFNLPYAVLPRLEPIALFTVPRVIIHAKQQGHFGVMNSTSFVAEGRTLDGDVSGFGGMVAMGAGALVTREQQKPEETLRDVLSAWGHVGMTALSSLDAADEAELADSYVVFEAVMGAARDEAEVRAGRRYPHMTLEDFPFWLAGRNRKGEKIPGVEDAVSHALSNGVTRLVKGTAAGEVVAAEPRHYKFPRGGEARARRLITEIGAAVARATEYAIGPQNGVLVKTRRAVQIARNGGGPESKNHYDELDIFLMHEFPSFDMDTDVERAKETLARAVEKNGEDAGDTASAMLKLAEQNARILEMVARGQEQTNKILATIAGDKKKPAGGA